MTLRETCEDAIRKQKAGILTTKKVYIEADPEEILRMIDAYDIQEIRAGRFANAPSPVTITGPLYYTQDDIMKVLESHEASLIGGPCKGVPDDHTA